MKACKFCGEIYKLRVVLKWMRGKDWRDRKPAGYVQCQKCKARGPLIVKNWQGRQQVYDDAILAWDGVLLGQQGAEGTPLFEGRPE